MSKLTQRMDRFFYPTYENNWDDIAFRSLIVNQIWPHYNILDLGAGPGIVPHMNFRGDVANVCGLDIDRRVLNNPFLDDAKVGNGMNIPYNNSYFDLVFTNNVFEHLEEPRKIFLEVNRVLKPGGVFMAKTSNKWHYVTVLSRITPHGFHVVYNQYRGRNSLDTCPTRYRVNTNKIVKKYAKSTGFSLAETHMLEGRPEYLRVNPVTYLAGLAYERIVNKIKFGAPFRVVMIVIMKKCG